MQSATSAERTYLENHGFLVWVTQAEDLAHLMIERTYG